MHATRSPIRGSGALRSASLSISRTQRTRRLGHFPGTCSRSTGIFVHQEPAPPDEEVLAFWEAHIPTYPDVYRDALDRWRVNMIGDLVSDKRRQEGRPGNGPFSRLGRLRDAADC